MMMYMKTILHDIKISTCDKTEDIGQESMLGHNFLPLYNIIPMYQKTWR